MNNYKKYKITRLQSFLCCKYLIKLFFYLFNIIKLILTFSILIATYYNIKNSYLVPIDSMRFILFLSIYDNCIP